MCRYATSYEKQEAVFIVESPFKNYGRISLAPPKSKAFRNHAVEEHYCECSNKFALVRSLKNDT